MLKLVLKGNMKVSLRRFLFLGVICLIALVLLYVISSLDTQRIQTKLLPKYDKEYFIKRDRERKNDESYKISHEIEFPPVHHDSASDIAEYNKRRKEIEQQMEENRDKILLERQIRLELKEKAKTKLQLQEEKSETQLLAKDQYASAHWLDLNQEDILRHFPRLFPFGEYRLRPFIDPADLGAFGHKKQPSSLVDMSDAEAEERFYQLVSTTHLKCGRTVRLGPPHDGGWDVCVAKPFKLKRRCLVYSFGIANDFSFDDAVAAQYQCKVLSFDPSMNQTSHRHTEKVRFYDVGLSDVSGRNSKGWQMKTLKDILKKFRHSERLLDYLKMDIEASEWGALRTALQDGALKYVKQLALEVHTPEVDKRPAKREDYDNMYRVLLDLEKAGFRKYLSHANPLGGFLSIRTNQQKTCCYELYYINMHFVKLKLENNET